MNHQYKQWLFRTPQERIVEFASRAARFIPEDTRRILDIGCGNGALLRELANSFPEAHLVGADLSGPNIEQANSLNTDPQISFVEVDYMHFETQSFDAIVSNSTLNLLPVDKDELFAKISSDLGKGGILIVSMPKDCMYNNILILLRHMLRLVRGSLVDRLIFMVGRSLTAKHVPDEEIAQNVGYMYIVPTHMDGVQLREAARRAGLEFVRAECEDAASIAKLRHNIVVFRKSE